jgi:hypothetical protein
MLMITKLPTSTPQEAMFFLRQLPNQTLPINISITIQQSYFGETANHRVTSTFVATESSKLFRDPETQRRKFQSRGRKALPANQKHQ